MEVPIPTDCNGNLFERVRLYPNPASSVVRLEIPRCLVVSGLTLTEMSGKAVRSYVDVPERLDISGLASGVYIIHIGTDRGSVIRKLIVN